MSSIIRYEPRIPECYSLAVRLSTGPGPVEGSARLVYPLEEASPRPGTTPLGVTLPMASGPRPSDPGSAPAPAVDYLPPAPLGHTRDELVLFPGAARERRFAFADRVVIGRRVPGQEARPGEMLID